jgi:hypothetical protein
MVKINRRWKVGVRKADSKWEEKLQKGVLKNCKFHDPNYRVDYNVEHVYNPDFVTYKNGKVILIESKGRFQDRSESSKYIWIREHLPEGWVLVFLFYNPKGAMPFAKKRKDGTKQSHAEWAELNLFKWYTEETIGEVLNGTKA